MSTQSRRWLRPSINAMLALLICMRARVEDHPRRPRRDTRRAGCPRGPRRSVVAGVRPRAVDRAGPAAQPRRPLGPSAAPGTDDWHQVAGGGDPRPARPRPHVTIVVDSSAVVAALVDDGPDGTWARDGLRGNGLTAAAHLYVEVSNVLRRAVD